MNTDNMQVVVRPMSTSQAVDLGTMMARHWFVPLWKIWMGLALPTFLVGYLMIAVTTKELLSWSHELGFFVFWWLKPIYEKPMVTWLGKALFDSDATQPIVIKQNIQSARRVKSGLLNYWGKLLVRHRLSTQRQLMLPILQLEQPTSEQFRTRLNIMQRGQGGGISWHTIILLHVESLFAVGMMLVLSQLVPATLLDSELLIAYLEGTEAWMDVLLAVLYFIGASLIAPFYVAGGFAVYLTKRCLLEGWDVELVFKDLSRRFINRRQKLEASP